MRNCAYSILDFYFIIGCVLVYKTQNYTQNYKLKTPTKYSNFFLGFISIAATSLKGWGHQIDPNWVLDRNAHTCLQLSKTLVPFIFDERAWLRDYRKSNRISDVFLFHLPSRSFVRSGQALWHVRRSTTQNRLQMNNRLTHHMISFARARSM